MNYIFLLGCCLILISCGTNEVVPIVSSGEVAFTIKPVEISNKSGRLADANPSSVVVSIESSTGEVILDEQKIDIISFNNSYLVNPILLEQGDYKLTKFLVLNESEEVVYASPVEGSVLAPFVSNPLALPFSIGSDEVTQVEIEVVNTESINPEDLGYASISFTIVPSLDVLVSVLKQEFDSYHFVNSTLTVSGDNDSLYSLPIGDSINVVKVLTDYNELTFSVTTDDGLSAEIKVSTDSISNYRTTPLTIILPNELTLLPAGLYALLGNNIVLIDTLTATTSVVTEVNDFPTDISPGFLTYNDRDGFFYLIEARTETVEDRSYTLAKISTLGEHQEIGVISFDGLRVLLIEGLDFDEQSGLLYASANLDATPQQIAPYSASIVTIDIVTAEATYVTRLSTNVANVDADDIVIHNGTYFLADGAPPGANFHKFYSFDTGDILEGQITKADLIFTTQYILGARMAVSDNYIYLAVNRELLRLGLSNPFDLQLVGATHATSDFDGSVFTGLTYIQ